VLTYLTQVDMGVPSGLALTNDAQASTSSLPGDVPGDRDDVTNNDDETHYTPLATGLRKFVTPPTVTIGSQVVYTYQLPYPLVGATLHNVVFTDVIPSNFIVTSVSGDGGFISNWSGGNLITGTVVSIPANRLVVITVTCTVRDVVTNTAVMDYSGNPNDPPASNPVTTTLAEPRVVLGKAVQLPRDPLGAGDAVTYTLTLTNTGDWPAFDLVITDALPVGITFLGTEHFAVSDPVTATLADANVGPSVIDVLPLHDHYDPYYLSFVDAVPYPDARDNDVGVLTWYDLTAPLPGGVSGCGWHRPLRSTTSVGRDLPPGDAFFVTTVFTVAHTIDVTTTNVVTVSGAIDECDNPANEDQAVVVITDTIPTAAELRYFRIGAVAGHEVRLEWATAVEVDNFGFKLYRASVVERSRASAVAFVPPQAWGRGATYVYTDTVPSDGLWWYWLADVDMSGLETFHGPVWAGVGVDTSFQRVFLPLVMR